MWLVPPQAYTFCHKNQKPISPWVISEITFIFYFKIQGGGGIKREKRKYKRGKEFKKFKDQVKKAREIANYSDSNWYILALNWQWVSSHKYPPKGYIRTSVEGKQTLTRCEDESLFWRTGWRLWARLNFLHMFRNHFSSSEPNYRQVGPITSQSG